MSLFNLKRCVVVFGFLISKTLFAQTAPNPYQFMKTKVWLWADSMQVQFTEPYTNTSAIVYVKYDIAKTTVQDLTVDSMGLSETAEVHPTLLKLSKGSIYEIIMALRSLNLKTLEYINFNAPKDTTENAKGELVYGSFLPLNSRDHRMLAKLQTEDRKNLYRINRLINERLISELQGFKPSITQATSCGEFIKVD